LLSHHWNSPKIYCGRKEKEEILEETKGLCEIFFYELWFRFYEFYIATAI
jgi:hypothetical protein